MRWVRDRPDLHRMREGHMASKSSYLIGGLAIVAIMAGVLPAAQGVASTKEIPVGEFGGGVCTCGEKPRG